MVSFSGCFTPAGSGNLCILTIFNHYTIKSHSLIQSFTATILSPLRGYLISCFSFHHMPNSSFHFPLSLFVIRYSLFTHSHSSAIPLSNSRSPGGTPSVFIPVSSDDPANRTGRFWPVSRLMPPWWVARRSPPAGGFAPRDDSGVVNQRRSLAAPPSPLGMTQCQLPTVNCQPALPAGRLPTCDR
jgi:hypothetical protein